MTDASDRNARERSALTSQLGMDVELPEVEKTNDILGSTETFPKTTNEPPPSTFSLVGSWCRYPGDQLTWLVAMGEDNSTSAQSTGFGNLFSLGPLSRKCVRPNAHRFFFSDTCII